MLSVPLFSIHTEALYSETGIPLAIMGMVVVFSALLILIFFVSMLPRVMPLIEKVFPTGSHHHGAAKPKPKAKPAAGGGEKAGEMIGGVPEEVAVVIAAAVASVMDQPHRIVRTRQLTASELAWTLQGRIQHHASHKLKPRDR